MLQEAKRKARVGLTAALKSGELEQIADAMEAQIDIAEEAIVESASSMQDIKKKALTGLVAAHKDGTFDFFENNCFLEIYIDYNKNSFSNESCFF